MNEKLMYSGGLCIVGFLLIFYVDILINTLKMDKDNIIYKNNKLIGVVCLLFAYYFYSTKSNIILSDLPAYTESSSV